MPLSRLDRLVQPKAAQKHGMKTKSETKETAVILYVKKQFVNENNAHRAREPRAHTRSAENADDDVYPVTHHVFC